MQKKILGLGMAALLALGLILSGCKDDAGGPTSEVWEGTIPAVIGTEGTQVGKTWENVSATLTLTGSDWRFTASKGDLDIDEKGTFTILAEAEKYKSVEIKQESRSLGTATINDGTMVLQVTVGGCYFQGTLTKK